MTWLQYLYALVNPDSLPDAVSPEIVQALFYGNIGIVFLTSLLMAGLAGFLAKRILARVTQRGRKDVTGMAGAMPECH